VKKLIGVFVLLAVFSAGYVNAQLQQLPAPAPDFTLETLTGERVQLSKLHGKYVVLHFWTTWCPYCKKEWESLERFGLTLFDMYPDLKILTVASKESKEKLQSYAKRNGISVTPILLDTDDKVATEYGVMFIPATYFINKNGALIHFVFGPLQWTSIKMLSFLNNFVIGSYD
jgi:peroxiredoxin